ncbi:hypothetical protein MPLA_680084 [Mesorhizobium sp. ORS 3359]|nr:hypothetical protein MPLA_680084 [Mesorhizobium sp. ORS 3359]
MATEESRRARLTLPPGEAGPFCDRGLDRAEAKEFPPPSHGLMRGPRQGAIIKCNTTKRG